MFLMDRKNKMFRKIAIIVPIFFFCLGLDNCKSPVAPEELGPSLEYKYNVEVIYSDVAEGESDSPLYLYYGIYDIWGAFNSGQIRMTKIGEKKARCYLPKVIIHTEEDNIKHSVSVVDPNKQPLCDRGENIDVQGAYELEIGTQHYCSVLLFKMSKE